MPRAIFMLLTGAAFTIGGSVGLFIILAFIRDGSIGFHFLIIEAGWTLYGLWRIAVGVVALLRKKERPRAANDIAFGAGTILMAPICLLFLPFS
jgi:hypothetical protein